MPSRNRAAVARTVLAGTLWCVLWDTSLKAQEPDDPQPDTPPVEATPALPDKDEPRSTRAIEEIIVTATKREESVRDIAASVTALRGEDLEQMGAQGQDDFLKLVPGVNVYDDGGLTSRRITIRGISGANETVGTTGILIGDVPFNDPLFPRVVLDPNPFDLASIEILKGPQGTLFGGQALNGAIRYVPQPPVMGQWQSKGFAQYESVHAGDSGLIYGAAANIPLYGRDDAALRLVGHSRRSPGWIDEFHRAEKDVNKITQTGGRGLLLWQPNDRWDVSCMVMAQDSLTADFPFADNGEGRLSRSTTPRPSPIRAKFDVESLGIKYGFDDFDFLSQTSRTFRHYVARIDGSRSLGGDRPPPNLLAVTDSRGESYVQEFRLTSNTSAGADWQWLAGAFAYRGSLFQVADGEVGEQSAPVSGDASGGLIPGFEGFVTEDGKFNVVHFSPDIEANELALFGEVTGVFWNALEVTLGLRAYRLNTNGTITSSGPLTASTAAPGQTEATFTGDITERGLNPKLAIQYPVNDHIGVYGAVARGFRFGGIQFATSTATTDVPNTFKSDSIWSYELGTRTQWLEDSLIADLTAFYIDWTTPQIYQLDQPIGSHLDNVGGARSIGTELATQYLPPIEGLSLSLAAAWVDTVTTVPFTSNNGVPIEPGSPWPLTPEYQTAATLAYERRIGPWIGSASVVHTYIGEAFSDLEQSLTQFDFQTVDLRFTLGDAVPGALPELSLSLTNLTDTRGLVGAIAGVSDHTYIRPRTLILRLSTEL